MTKVRSPLMALVDISSIKSLTFVSVLIAHYFSPIAASPSDMLAVAVEAAKAAGEVSFYCLCIS